VILTGIAGNICVLFTANDAYMREVKLFVPADCIVSNTTADNEYAPRQIDRLCERPAQENPIVNSPCRRRS
jgi:nicotinamidase-related amidase